MMALITAGGFCITQSSRAGNISPTTARVSVRVRVRVRGLGLGLGNAIRAGSISLAGTVHESSYVGSVYPAVPCWII